MFDLMRTDDYKGLTEIFNRNGLEITIGEEPPKGLIGCWEVIESDSGKRVGGMALEKRDDEFLLKDMAVEKEYRNHKLGILMLNKAIEELKLSGAKRILLVAKVPGFYKKQGFIPMDMKDVPDIGGCTTCKRFNADCFPEIMYLDLE